MIDTKIIEAFHLMWDNFPEPVMLVHKTREIIAVNSACSKAGGTAGIKCSSIGSPEQHKRCLANQALASQRATYSKGESNGRTVIGYWIPLPGHPDVYVHFGVGTMIDYDTCHKTAEEKN
ncbi:hypothetical protein [Sporomusa sp.]|jgi:hypothetical protein|uniref:hypothetical protein n=1 Tax=Sporomusa sp. TaxID=2078658 RepID=UPI002CE63C2E|nr:hypothetical protein [Sporomusa sp.]HWR08073.1 hypothetical protein [Sporomusa sp.]